MPPPLYRRSRSTLSMDASPAVNRHVFAILFAIAILHLVFAFTLWIPLRVFTGGSVPFDPGADGLFVLLFLGQVALFAVLVWAGLFLGRSVGLGAPLLESWSKGEPVREQAARALWIALALGLGVAALKYLLDLLVFSPFLPATLSGGRQVDLLRFVIPFQQGVGDEITYRLFGMTAIIWIFWKLRGSGETPSPDWMFRAGILLAGLPGVAGLVLRGVAGLPLVQYATILLAGAIPFGWLYWRKGIGAAIAAHVVSSLALVLLTAL